ncbi:unnamed protein product [Orchesella dallaii]|uniref:Death domain-containing protein n=1 Tax=Orchesella dallaii TaxID=48710 RepID=A0ABP1RBE4_9HEXA
MNIIVDGVAIKFNEMYDTIDPQSLIPKRKWRDIAFSLDIPAEEIEDIDSDIRMHKLSMRNIFILILTSWALAKDENATVGQLIYVLEKENLKSCANRLRRKYGIEILQPKNQFITLHSVSENSSLNLNDEVDSLHQTERQKQFILENLPILVDLLALNVGTLSILIAKGLLTKDDIADLDEIKNERKKNLHFLENILPKKLNFFSALYEAMKITNQTGVLSVLDRFQLKVKN